MRNIPLRLWLLTLLSSALQISCFPIAGPAPAWRAALCWIALAPFLLALTSSNSKGNPLRIREGLSLGYSSGILWYLGNCYWIFATMHTYGGIAKPAAAGILLLFCLYLGLYHAAFAAAFSVIHRKIGKRLALLSAPFLWVTVELARARITGFPWDQLGIAQIDNPWLTRIAPYTGVYGLSFAIVAFNTLWLARITLQRRRYTGALLAIVGAVAVLLCVGILGRLPTRPLEPASEIATLVQENLEVGAPAVAANPPLGRGEMLSAFSELSLFPPSSEACDGMPEAAGTHCGTPSSEREGRSHAGYLAPTQLIVWPEAPNDFYDADPEFRTAISQLARAARAPVIAGSIGVTPNQSAAQGYDLFNSADFFLPDGSFAARYDKMHLVPFGEYVPYKRLFFFAGSLLQNVGVFRPGQDRRVLISNGHTYGVFICYESVFSDEVRQYARMGAEVLVNISDDGWYGDTSAAWEHLNQARMRAIENHRWVLRATNTGVTAAIDPYGRVTAAIPRHIRSSLRAGFSYQHNLTFYAAHGDLFAWFCVLVALAGICRSAVSVGSRP